jgi:hypothetical protein
MESVPRDLDADRKHGDRSGDHEQFSRDSSSNRLHGLVC